MDMSVSPSATLYSPEPPPTPPTPSKERRSALKRTKSIRTSHVQFGDVAFEPELTPRTLFPPSPTKDISIHRQHPRPTLKRTSSTGSTRSSLARPRFHEELETPALRETGGEPQFILTPGEELNEAEHTTDQAPDPFFADANDDTDDLGAWTALRPPSLSRHLSTGERSSARDCAQHDNPVETLQKMIDTLRASGIPGPELLRSRSDFSKSLGYGGEGNVQGTDEKAEEKILRARKSHSPEWIAHRFAIKRHGPQLRPRWPDQHELKLEDYLGSAAAEIQAFSKLPDGHPNIIQLQGWGLCLDTIEWVQSLSKPPTDLSAFSLHLPLLVFKRAEGDLKEFLYELFGDEPLARDHHNPQSLAERGHMEHSTPLLQPGSEGQGVFTPYMTIQGPARPESHSLSGSTLNDYVGENANAAGVQAEAAHGYDTAGVDTLGTLRKPRRFQIVKGIDRDEVVRGLCIDIGHGLQHLHHLNMTHGDLKPRNVLVSSDGPRWTAKLCDLGHSRSFASPGGDTDTATQRYTYRGTPDWRPHWFGPRVKTHDRETLMSFDRTVYGALVWSAFSPTLRGNKPPISEDGDNPCMHLPKHLMKMAPKGGCRSPMGSKAALARHVGRLVESTVCEGFLLADELDPDPDIAEPKHRVEQRPWKYLYSRTERAARALWRGMKAAESRLEARRDTALNHDTAVTTPDPASTADASAAATPAASPQSGSGDEMQSTSDSGVKPTRSLEPAVKSQRSAAFDEWWRGRRRAWRPWEPKKSESGVQELHDRLQSLISNNSRTSNMDGPGSPYGAARLRAKALQLAEWNRVPKRKNIVELALQARPPIDICTLAWLCRGEIGAQEVYNLRPSCGVWEVLLSPDTLDESARLERFLLLMQFGARIEQVLQNHPTSPAPRSILGHYLRSCRVATVPAVSDEICRRFEQVLAAGTAPGHDSTRGRSTRYFMTAASRDGPSHAADDATTVTRLTALEDMTLDRPHYGAVFQVLRLNFRHLLAEQNDIDAARARDRPNETTPLLRNPWGPSRTPTWERSGAASSKYFTIPRNGLSTTTPGAETATAAPSTQSASAGSVAGNANPLPRGWIKRGETYVNELTGSLTLREPKMPTKLLRRISIGHLGSPHVWEIDIADFALPQHHHDDLDPSRQHSKEEARHRLRQRIRDRFSAFDDAWFAAEPSMTVGEDDVLAEIKDIITTASTGEGNTIPSDNTPTLRRSSSSFSPSSAFHIQLLRANRHETAALPRLLRTLLFFAQYPMTTLGLLWHYAELAHAAHGAPIDAAHAALDANLRGLRRGLDAAETSLSRTVCLLRWAPALLARFVVLLLAWLACLACLVGVVLVVAVVLALLVAVAIALAAL
ncbi:hypothetical protein B0T24DRAFT_686848 [Lasiosphaeria ovina]|uniref:Protein kinase domain-containing protein n=1 Tax=Lasiosphaeria ovina TaxID=92902 RepID=A0AAE0TX01_9PEZI|nr:hypothetical protein B0T24DRAFT_686848 [Lasiosphaeria ovina]